MTDTERLNIAAEKAALRKIIREVGRLMALFIDEISRGWEDLKWY